MSEIDYAKRRLEDVPERWRNIDFTSATDSDIEELVEDIYKYKVNINLTIPLLPETVRAFFEIFHCQRCGDCCLGVDETPDNGIILEADEVERLSGIRLLSKKKFKEEFTFTKGGRRLLRYPCPFYDPNSHSCTIYQIRPFVCQLYPLNNPMKPKGLHRSIDGTYIIAVNSLCVEGRRVACHILKIQRDVSAFYKKLDKKDLALIQKASESFWMYAQKCQIGSSPHD